MVQTITIRSDGSYDINTGQVAVDQSIDIFSADLSAKITGIVNTMLSDGIVEIHSEKDTWRQFEHARTSIEVDAYDFGTKISASDFDWIIAEVKTAVEQAELEANEQDPEPEVI